MSGGPAALGVGIHPNVSRAEYERIEAINVSILQHFDRSDVHAQDAMLHPPEPSRAMNLGTLLHMAVLEPDRFDASYVVPIECDRRTTVGKAAWAAFLAENEGKETIPADDHRDLIGMRDSIWKRPIAQQMLAGEGLSEVAIVWTDEETGILCKGLLDRLVSYAGYTWIVDVKSTRDASREGFSREIKKHFYGARAAWYFDGCNTLAPRERRFAWLAVENERPYAAAEYEADESALERGRERYKRWLRRYAEAKRTGTWLGYPDELQAIGANDTEYGRAND